jgi:broad specificity phosphatase PhoE
MRIILVRHGETVDNVKGLTQGHKHGRLTDKGKRQALLLAEELKKYRIDAIYSSDRGRAAQTARLIAKQHRHVPVVYSKELMEIGKGRFDGKPRKLAEDAQKASGVPKHKWRPSGGESWVDVQKRVRKLLISIKKTHRSHTVLLVGHGRVNSIVLYTLTKTPLGHTKKFVVSPNASVTIVDINRKGKAGIKLLNYTRHLGKLHHFAAD